MQTDALRVVPASPALAAEVLGIDLSAPMKEVAFGRLLAAWHDHPVLLFRSQDLSDEDLVRFSSRFGTLYRAPPNEEGSAASDAAMPGRPEVVVISNVVENGVPLGALGAYELEWHTDMSYLPSPPSASVLYALEVPAGQGHTTFADMYSAYAALPDAMKRAIRARELVHDASYTSAGERRKSLTLEGGNSAGAPVRHPMVRMHPSTMRPALFLGRRRGASVVGLSRAENDRLLDELWALATKPAFCWVHEWQVGDVLIWDNRCTMHRRAGFDPTFRRIMYRTQVEGETPIRLAG